MEENRAVEAQSPEKPTQNTELGRFKSLEAKQRSLGNLKPPFKPGQVTPGAGRPRMDGPATKAMRKLLRSKFPNDPKSRSYLQLVVEGVIKSAIKGNVFAAELIFERLEGRVPLPVESDLPVNITVVVNRNTPRYPESELPQKHGSGLVLEANVSGTKANG